MLVLSGGNKKLKEFNNFLQIKKELLSFYKTYFNTQDRGLPGLPIPSLRDIDFTDRFILPDIQGHEYVSNNLLPPDSNEHSSFTKLTNDNLPNNTSVRNVNIYNQSRFGVGFIPNITSNESNALQTEFRQIEPKSAELIRFRIPSDKWLIKNPRNIILGEPGSGKSTLLRYILLDSLEERPNLNRLKEKWSLYIPIWVSFPSWIKRNEESIDLTLETPSGAQMSSELSSEDELRGSIPR